MPIKLRGLPVSEGERAYDKIHAWFFAYPEDEFTLNELHRNLEVSKTSVNLVVTSLEKEGFLEKRVLGKVWRISANQAHAHFKTRKIPFNLKHVYECGILEWITTNLPEARAVVLFGSYRWGDDIQTSDIDIAVEVVDNQEQRIISLVVGALGYRKNINVNIHVFSRKHIDANLFASVANGIVLMGFLEVRP